MPNRILKESVCTSATLSELDGEAERLFYRLIVQCDDFGRYHAHPGLVRGACFPRQLDSVDDASVRRWLQALERAGLIQIYEVDGEQFLALVKWDKHQRPARAQKSKFPPRPADNGGERIPPAEIRGQMTADVDNCGQSPPDADSGGQMLPRFVNRDSGFENREPGRARTREGPTKAELSRGFPFLAEYAKLTERKPSELTTDDVRAAERLVEEGRDPDQLEPVLAWMARNRFHCDPTKLASVERNWPKFEVERREERCGCGGGGARSSPSQSKCAISSVDHTGCPAGCSSRHPEQCQQPDPDSCGVHQERKPAA